MDKFFMGGALSTSPLQGEGFLGHGQSHLIPCAFGLIYLYKKAIFI